MQITTQIIEACLRQDRAAQKQLYQQLWPYLNGICKRYLYRSEDAPDVLQETFLLIFKNLGQYDFQKASFASWAGKITINCCLKQLRTNNRRPSPEQIIPLYEPLVSPAIISQLSTDDLLRLVQQLPPALLQVFNLYVVDEFSHPEIAQMLGITETLSRKRLSRARAWLKKKFPEDRSSSLHLNYQ